MPEGSFKWNTRAKLNDIIYCVFSRMHCTSQISRNQLWSSLTWWETSCLIWAMLHDFWNPTVVEIPRMWYCSKGNHIDVNDCLILSFSLSFFAKFIHFYLYLISKSDIYSQFNVPLMLHIEGFYVILPGCHGCFFVIDFFLFIFV